MKYCIKCGKEILGNDAYCAECLKEIVSDFPTEVKTKRCATFSFVCGLVAIVAFVVALFFAAMYAASVQMSEEMGQIDVGIESYALTALILGIVATLLGIAATVLGVLGICFYARIKGRKPVKYLVFSIIGLALGKESIFAIFFFV